MFNQYEKDENNSDRELRVYYCDEHRTEGEKNPNKWTKEDKERLEKKKEQVKLERAEKLNNQKGLFYCQDAYAHAVEGKLRERTLKYTKYGCFEFWGRENGKSFYLLIPDTHPVLDNFKYQEKEKRNGAEVEFTRYNLQEKFFLIEGIEKLPLEANRDSQYSGNDPLIQAQHFSKVVGLNDKITITPVDSQENLEKNKPVENKPTDKLSNSLPKELNDKTLLQYFKEKGIKSIKLDINNLIIEYNNRQEKETKKIKDTESQQIKSFAEKLGKSELSLSDLEQNSDSSNSPDKNSKGLYIGLAVIGVLVIGVIAWLLIRNRKKISNVFV